MTDKKNNPTTDGLELGIEAVIRSQFGQRAIDAGDKAMLRLYNKAPSKSSTQTRRVSARMASQKKSTSSTRNIIFAAILGGVIPIAAGIMIFLHLKSLQYAMPGNPIIMGNSIDSHILRQNEKVSLISRSKLLPNDVIVVSDEHVVTEIIYDDGSRVEIKKGSMVQVFKDPSKKLISLKQGRLYTNITKQKSEEECYLFKTPNSNVQVVGTSFKLFANHELTKIKMEEGVVKVHDTLHNKEYMVQNQEELVLRVKEPAPKAPEYWEFWQTNDLLALYHLNNNEKNSWPMVLDSLLGKNLIIRNPSEVSNRMGVRIEKNTSLIGENYAEVFQKFCENDQFSIECWVKPFDGDQGEGLIIAGGPRESILGQTNWFFYISQEKASIRAVLKTDSKEDISLFVASTSTIDFKKPVHLIFQKNKQHLQLFINGNLHQEVTLKGHLNQWTQLTSSVLLLGGTGAGSHQWQGLFYQMAMYQNPLDAEQIKKHFEHGY